MKLTWTGVWRERNQVADEDDDDDEGDDDDDENVWRMMMSMMIMAAWEPVVCFFGAFRSLPKSIFHTLWILNSFKKIWNFFLFPSDAAAAAHFVVQCK